MSYNSLIMSTVYANNQNWLAEGFDDVSQVHSINSAAPNYYQITSTSYGNNQITFNQRLPDSLVYHRTAWIEYDLQVVVGINDAAATDTPRLDPIAANIAKLPLNRVTQNSSLMLNNTTVTFNTGIMADALTKYGLDHVDQSFMSQCPYGEDTTPMPTRDLYTDPRSPYQPITETFAITPTFIGSAGAEYRNSMVSKTQRAFTAGVANDFADGFADSDAGRLKRASSTFQGNTIQLTPGNINNTRSLFHPNTLTSMTPVTITAGAVTKYNMGGTNPNAGSPNGYLFEYHIIEPVIHPFFTMPKENKFFCNVTDFQLQLNLYPDLGPMVNFAGCFMQSVVMDGTSFAIAPPAPHFVTDDGTLAALNLFTQCVPFAKGFGGQGGNTILTAGNTAPKLLLIAVQPTINIPKTKLLPYEQVSYKIKDCPQFPLWSKNKVETVKTDNFQLQEVPQRVYIYAQMTKDKTGSQHHDKYLEITDLVIKMDGAESIYINTNEKHLFDISKRNGFWGDFQQWKECGSVMCLDVDQSDLGAYISGTRQAFNIEFQVSLNYQLDPYRSKVTYCRGVTGATQAGTSDYLLGKKSGPVAPATGFEFCSSKNWRLHFVFINNGTIAFDSQVTQISTGHHLQTAALMASSKPSLNPVANSPLNNAEANGAGFGNSKRHLSAFLRRARDAAPNTYDELTGKATAMSDSVHSGVNKFLNQSKGGRVLLG